MTQYPLDLDDDTSLPIVSDNLTEIGNDAINAINDAIIAIETELGTNLKGSKPSLQDRLLTSFASDGYVKPSAIAALGYVTLPIFDNQIAENAGIAESKLDLQCSTSSLYNTLIYNSNLISSHDFFLSNHGIKVDEHLAGTKYNHYLSHILIGSTIPKNRLGNNRNNANAFALLTDLNNELIYHQKTDGVSQDPTQDGYTVITNSHSYPSIYGHIGYGIYLQNNFFETSDFHSLVNYIDSNFVLNEALRYQNLYANGISRESQSASLLSDVGGRIIIPTTSCYTYLLNDGDATSPLDSIDIGDDIIKISPNTSLPIFDVRFNQISVGDYAVVTYSDNIERYYLIKEINFIPSKLYQIRINGKNKFFSNASIRIEKTTFNTTKQHVLALAPENYTSSQADSPGVLAIQPRGACVIGDNPNLNLLSLSKYNLYLQMYPNGDPDSYYLNLPAIDVTGDSGATYGTYTLSSICQSINDKMRSIGYNYRFAAFEFEGKFGIALSDSYNNVSFSIRNDASPYNAFDALGLSDYASPTFTGIVPNDPNLATKVFYPSKRNNFYVNGSERERFDREDQNILDSFGDGYYLAYYQAESGTNPIKRTYRIIRNLPTTKLWQGASVVIQPNPPETNFNDYGSIQYGRFIVESITYQEPNNTYLDGYTDIVLFDSCHANVTDTNIREPVQSSHRFRIYLCHDTITVNKENVQDTSIYYQYNRIINAYIDNNGKTFTIERARYRVLNGTIAVNGMNLTTNANNSAITICNISNDLKGYLYSGQKKITLRIVDNDNPLGTYGAYICNNNGGADTEIGKFKFAKKGEITRFYANDNNAYIDVFFDLNIAYTQSINSIDIQLFDSLDNDEEVFELGTFHYNYATNKVAFIKDKRQFGTISEKNLSSSCQDFINANERLTHQNGIIAGFDIITDNSIPPGKVRLSSGTALINGKIIDKNDMIVSIPRLVENYNNAQYPILWAVCLNDKSEIETIPLLDYDPLAANVNASDRIINAETNFYTNFNMTGYSFTELLNKKELVPLYIYSATVVVSIILSFNPTSVLANESFTITATLTTSDGTVAPGFITFTYLDTSTNTRVSMGAPAAINGSNVATLFYAGFPTNGTYTIYATYAGT